MTETMTTTKAPGMLWSQGQGAPTQLFSSWGSRGRGEEPSHLGRTPVPCPERTSALALAHLVPQPCWDPASRWGQRTEVPPLTGGGGNTELRTKIKREKRKGRKKEKNLQG